LLLIVPPAVTGRGFLKEKIMKCAAFEVKNTTNWPVLECGGAMVSAGDIILMRDAHARIFGNSNKLYLDRLADRQVERLRGGHYQIITKKEKDQDKEDRKRESLVSNKMQDKVADKSMLNKAKKKVKRKRN